MGFLGQLLQGDNKVTTTPYQGQANLANEAQSALSNQGAISAQQQAFLNALTQNAQGAASGLNTLGGQLQTQAAGGGPNPALNQLNQATNENTANTAAQIANTRGINPGLAGRLAAQSGAGLQQQAAGQAATMGAQQQLAAQNALSTLYGNQVNQAQNQQNFTGQQGLAQQQILQGALGEQNKQNLEGQQANTKGANAIGGGILNGLTGIASGLLGIKPPQQQQQQMAHGGQLDMKSGGHVPGEAPVPGDSYQNDTIHAMLSPKEIVLPRSVTMDQDAPEKAKAFVQAILNSKGSFGKVVAAKRNLSKKD